MTINLNEIKSKSPTELMELAQSLDLQNTSRLRKQEQIFAILKALSRDGDEVIGEGVAEILPDGYGFLRSSKTSYFAGSDDIYMSASQIRRFGLRTGDTVTGQIRPPKDSEKYFALLKVEQINFH